MKLSDTFVAALVKSDTPAFRHAAAVGLAPWRLSRLLHGAEITSADRAALVKIGARLNVADVFEK